jgi:2-dehydro-3-deoxyphosphogluconate aldolase/(4S)-4-hydroxy-2-oxoglutarate aldolase
MDTMSRTLQTILETRLIAIMRAQSPAELTDAARALADGGVRCVEVTMNTPGALDVVRGVAAKLDGVVMGVGTVLDAETARLAILSGAQFIVSPTLNRDMVAMCRRYGAVAVPGAYTPTEILSAWECGADLVKVFPASVGGPEYIKAIRAPLPQVRLCPVGGVDLDNALPYLRAGAAAVALGGSLVKSEFLKNRDFAALTGLAKRLVEVVRGV